MSSYFSAEIIQFPSNLRMEKTVNDFNAIRILTEISVDRNFYDLNCFTE